jgi:predicted transposase YbfD/YdcC
MEGITLQEHFATLEDPRIDRTKHHQLLAIITIALCAVICGADTWVDVEEFGKAKRVWFERFLDLPNGIPSHDTFGRVFARLDPEQFQACFLSWVQAINTVLPAQQIAIDGKTARRSHDRGAGKAAIQTVSAWASATHLVLAQRHVKEHSNEQTALPILLKQLELAGCMADASTLWGACPRLPSRSKSRTGSMSWPSKPIRGRCIRTWSTCLPTQRPTGLPTSCMTLTTPWTKAMGGSNAASIGRLPIPNALPISMPSRPGRGCAALAWETAERRIGQQVSKERRYYIMSLAGEAQAFGDAVRSHWGVENGLHWVLDIAFQEDASRMRKDHSQQNFVVLRHMALNLLKQEHTAKCGIKARRLKAGWSDDYLHQVLAA